MGDAEPAAWRWEAQAPGLDEWHETHQAEPPEEFYGEQADHEFEVRNVTPLYEREDAVPEDDECPACGDTGGGDDVLATGQRWCSGDCRVVSFMEEDHAE